MEAHKPLKLKIKLPTRVQPEVMPEPGEAGLYTNKIHYFRKYLLDELVTKKFAMDFMEPVDAAALQVPNYYTIIKRPMDVGTIIKRVQNRYYHRVDDLICDFRLVISNCFMFNRPGDVVYRNCQKLEKFFHRVLNKMPKGEEKPSTKDPRSSGKHGYEKASEVVQRHCQQHLKKLQASIAKEDDKSIYKYFSTKLDYLSQKVDRYHFKSVEEFRYEVNSIFKNFDNHIKTFHELFHKTCDQDPQQRYANCHWSNELEGNKPAEEADSSVKLDRRDISEVLFALKRAESSVEHCVKSYSREKENRARSLIDAFDATASRLKQKLMRGRHVDTSREERRQKQLKCYNQLQERLHNQEMMNAQEANSTDDENREPQAYGNGPDQVADTNGDHYEEFQAESYTNMQALAPQSWPQETASDHSEDANMEKQSQPPGEAPAPPAATAPTYSMLWSDLQLSSSSDDSDECESS